MAKIVGDVAADNFEKSFVADFSQVYGHNGDGEVSKPPHHSDPFPHQRAVEAGTGSFLMKTGTAQLVVGYNDVVPVGGGVHCWLMRMAVVLMRTLSERTCSDPFEASSLLERQSSVKAEQRKEFNNML